MGLLPRCSWWNEEPFLWEGGTTDQCRHCIWAKFMVACRWAYQIRLACIIHKITACERHRNPVVHKSAWTLMTALLKALSAECFIDSSCAWSIPTCVHLHLHLRDVVILSFPSHQQTHWLLNKAISFLLLFEKQALSPRRLVTVLPHSF